MPKSCKFVLCFKWLADNDRVRVEVALRYQWSPTCPPNRPNPLATTPPQLSFSCFAFYSRLLPLSLSSLFLSSSPSVSFPIFLSLYLSRSELTDSDSHYVNLYDQGVLSWLRCGLKASFKLWYIMHPYDICVLQVYHRQNFNTYVDVMSFQLCQTCVLKFHFWFHVGTLAFLSL